MPTLIVLALMLAPPQPLEAGETVRTLNVGGLDRSYIVHVPPAYEPGRPTPVVLVLHGGGSNARAWVKFCGMNDKSDESGFIAVYPNGTGKRIEGYPEEVLAWNGGPHEPGGKNPERQNVDDVEFIGALLDDLKTVANVDPQKTYAAGMSMGGIMAYRLASELSERIAAIATIAGPMGTEACSPKRPVAVLHIHGTEDKGVPIEGGRGPIDTSGAEYISVSDSIQKWVAADGCEATPVMEALPDSADDGTHATRTTYGGGRENTEVVLVTVVGGGHTWPGREFGPEMSILGKSSQDFAANDLIWEFFQKHARTEPQP